MNSLRVDRFNELFRREYPEVFRFLARRVEPSVAADVAQETFTTAWRRLDDVPTDDSGARAWLYRTARNHLLNTQRSGVRQTALAIRFAEQAADMVAGPENGAIARHDLVTAWEALSPPEQEVLALIGWEELSVTESATVLGVSTVTVRARLRRARANLRANLERPLPNSRSAFVLARAAPLASTTEANAMLIGAQQWTD